MEMLSPVTGQSLWIVIAHTLVILQVTPVHTQSTTDQSVSNGTTTQAAVPTHFTATVGTTTPAAVSNFSKTFTYMSLGIPDVVITLALISACGLVGLGVAKLGEYCYDRRMAMKDDISNTSEYTRDLLRARLAVMKMKQDPEAPEDQMAKSAASTWVHSASKFHQPSTDVNQETGDTVAEEAEDEFPSHLHHTAPSSTDDSNANTLDRPVIAHNKVSPGYELANSTSLEGASANQLPPLRDTPGRPRTAGRALNQPIRSTRS